MKMFKINKSAREILEDAAMLVIGLIFAARASKWILNLMNVSWNDILQAVYKMPSALWHSGDDSLFCALVLLVAGTGLALSGWAFLSNYLESKNIALRDVLKAKQTL